MNWGYVGFSSLQNRANPAKLLVNRAFGRDVDGATAFPNGLDPRFSTNQAAFPG